MINVIRHFSLTNLNTMKLSSVADYFVHVKTVEELREALHFATEKQLRWVILGGGSNLLLSPNMSGLVIQMGMLGWHIDTSSEPNSYKLNAAAAESWHQLVRSTVEKGFFGLENLSLIPGTVGAAPVQNIGAYGVELSDRLDSVEVLDTVDESIYVLNSHECEFAYRDSLFKRNPGRFIILKVVLNLTKLRRPILSYPTLNSALQRLNITSIDAETISNVVIKIRQSKLPDPEYLPNTGSFYKNPIVSEETYQLLHMVYVDIPAYKINDQYKLAAGWLIERAGWKGYRNEKVGVHDEQALVLINHHQGNFDDLMALSNQIISSVKQKFGISLEIEPVIFKSITT
jgi:UDP-N-acetylmuramate dehydrogenase